jgi:hypothetical protein
MADLVPFVHYDIFDRLDWRDPHSLALEIDFDLHVNASLFRGLEGFRQISLPERTAITRHGHTFDRMPPGAHRYYLTACALDQLDTVTASAC